MAIPSRNVDNNGAHSHPQPPDHRTTTSRSVTDLDNTTRSPPPCLLRRSFLAAGIRSRRRVRGRVAGLLHHTRPWNSGVHFSTQLFDIWTHRKYQCRCMDFDTYDLSPQGLDMPILYLYLAGSISKASTIPFLVQSSCSQKTKVRITAHVNDQTRHSLSGRH